MTNHTNSRTYAAVFGRNPTLSVAELHALASSHGFSLKPLNRYAVELVDFDVSLADSLGGTTKIIELAPEVATDAESAVMRLAGQAATDRKLRFGVSSYSEVPATPLNKLMKKMLTKRGISSGFVAKREGRSGRQPDGELSAVQVYHNKLLTKGADWCLFQTPEGYRYGRTIWIYDFAGFNRRDYDKPVADARRGMLPPQLARTMVNLAGLHAGARLYDPFCGSGVVLMEAILAASAPKTLYGSDLSPQAVRDTVANLQWLKGAADHDMEFRIDPADATKPLPFREVEAIVTEGYLGEPVRESMTEADVEQQALAVETLLQRFLGEAAKVLSSKQRLILTVPAWQLHRGLRRLSVVDHVGEFGYTKVRPLPQDMKLPGLTDRDTIDVARPQARVIHELAILERT